MTGSRIEHRIVPVTAVTGRSPQIALFIPHVDGGGAERMTVNLANGLTNQGITVDLVLAQACGSFLAHIPENVRVIHLGRSRVMSCVFALANYLRKARPLVMKSSLDHANVCALLARRISLTRTRLFVTQHSVTSRIAEFNKSWNVRTIHFLMRRCYRWADGVVAVSSGVANMISEMTGVARDHVHVIDNPILGPEFLRMAEMPFAHPCPWLAVEFPPVIVAIGSLSAWKDQATLIRAVAKVGITKPVRLLVLGEGVERQRLENLIQELNAQDCVALCGFVANPYPHLRRASALVVSSKYEAFCNVLIEAMALGVPVISTDCDYGPREILMGGQYGILVPVGNVEVMAAAILRVLEGERKVVPKEFIERFTMKNSVDQHIRVLLDNNWKGRDPSEAAF